MSEERGNTRYINVKRVPFYAFLKFPGRDSPCARDAAATGSQAASHSVSQQDARHRAFLHESRPSRTLADGRSGGLVCLQAGKSRTAARGLADWRQSEQSMAGWRSEGVAGWSGWFSG